MSARVTAEILRMLHTHTTPGPWDSFNGHVSALVPPTRGAALYGRDSEDSHSYYGGELICESCDHADALFIAAAKNLVPELVTAHIAALERIADLQQALRFKDAQLTDALHMTDLVRSERYTKPAFWLVPTGRQSDSTNAFRAEAAD